MLMDWTHQTNSPLELFARSSGSQSRVKSGTNRQDHAAAILKALESQSRTLREVADATLRFPAFQISTNLDFQAVIRPEREQAALLERLLLVFQVRACASLASGQSAAAAEDVLTGLRLAQLARQLPDTRSTERVQGMLVRSLQPLWEGLSQHAWSEPQLASLQQELSAFNLLADYTNAVRRIVLAHIEVWRAVPDSTNSYITLPSADGYKQQNIWHLQPRSWWFESCIQLHRAGWNAIQHVDPASGRIQPALSWSDLNGLPLDYQTMELLQQSQWWGANPDSVAFVQTSVNQAIIACALERFLSLNASYPESLESLVPSLLPRVLHDAVSGRPIVYQSVPTGSFTLRGVGPNGIDDRKNTGFDDWLWTYSTNAPSAEQ